VNVLVVTNRLDATADYLCSRMAEANVEHVRLNTEAVLESCSFHIDESRREIVINGVHLGADDIGVVWYRRPEPIGVGPAGGDPYEQAFSRAEWMAATEGFLNHVPSGRWINHPSRIFAASGKLEQLHRAAAHGLSVPDWLCTTSTADAVAFYQKHSGGIVAKPLFSGYVERGNPADDTVIYTSPVQLEVLSQQGPHLGAPTLFQRTLRGPDIRITIVDDEIHAVRIERPDGKVDVRRDNMAGVAYSVAQPPEHVRRSLLALVRSYGLRFAAIDMLESRDGWQFLEVNPNGQWAWLDLVAGTTIYTAFISAFHAKPRDHE
jgi:glutathione synthase/RimK-type ligase-like ATP-grasp enzyme